MAKRKTLGGSPSCGFLSSVAIGLPFICSCVSVGLSLQPKSLDDEIRGVQRGLVILVGPCVGVDVTHHLEQRLGVPGEFLLHPVGCGIKYLSDAGPNALFCFERRDVAPIGLEPTVCSVLSKQAL